MTIDSKLEKAEDIIEQFWTSQGIDVNAGPKLAGNELALWYTIMDKDTTFRNLLIGKLTQEGYFRNGRIQQIEDASFTTICAAKDFHELDFRMQYIGLTEYGDFGRFKGGVGAEFNKNADGKYNLKLFIKSGSKRLVLNPDWKQQKPEIAEAVAKDFRLMYWLLQETGYLAKEE